MDIKLIALILLVIRIFSVIFISLVLVRQWKLFKLPVQEDLTNFRKVLFALSVIILIGDIVPTAVDILTAFGDVQRSASTVNAIGVAYGLSNAGAASVASLLIWLLYRMAARTIITQSDGKKIPVEVK